VALRARLAKNSSKVSSRAGAAVLHGPNHANFAQAYADFDDRGAALEVRDGAALGRALADLLDDPGRMADIGRRAERLATAQEERLDGLARSVLDTLLD